MLITGATGNVGMEILKSLSQLEHGFDVCAGVHDLKKDRQKLKGFTSNVLHFDFIDVSTYKQALSHCDILFLLRPPQLSEVQKYFKPLIDTAVGSGVNHIVFLSVQGAEKSNVIPHHKIEKLIVKSKIPYTFLRPAYFMQNFTTTLHKDLVEHHKIYLPAGDAKFTLVDVSDIGEVAAIILTEPEKHFNQSYELTSNEKLSFGEMADKLSKALRHKINYESPNLIQFYLTKRKEKMPVMLILVMILLHYLPRFQREPQVSSCIKKILKKEPRSFERFITNNLTALIE